MNTSGNTPLFSLLICAYNVEAFMRRGLEMVVALTGDFEVVICDDGSTDATGRIADDYAEHYDCVRVVHQRNTGLGGARNAAIAAARGEYLAFYDVDDVIDSNFFLVLTAAIGQHRGADVLVFGYNEICPFYHSRQAFGFTAAAYASNEEIRAAYVDQLSGLRFNNGFTWNKVYRRAFLDAHQLHFDDQRIQQDEVFNCAVYKVATTLVTLPDVLYDYYIYQSGNNRSKYIPNRLDIYRSVRDALLSLGRYWNLHDERFTTYVNRRFYASMLEHLDFNLHHERSGLTAAERSSAIAAVMSAPDVVACITYLMQHHALPRRRYAAAILAHDVARYERLRRRDKLVTCCKLKLHKLRNSILRR